MKALKLSILVVLLITCDLVLACSFADFRVFPPEIPMIKKKGGVPKAPTVSFEVSRGHVDSYDSCADTGTITLTISTDGYGRSTVGYLFEVVENSTGQKIFPEYAVYGFSPRGKSSSFVFPWIDGASDVQEPLKIVLNVYRVSSTWKKSEVVTVVIKHPGKA